MKRAGLKYLLFLGWVVFFPLASYISISECSVTVYFIFGNSFVYVNFCSGRLESLTRYDQESTCMNLSISCPYEILVYYVIIHIHVGPYDATRLHTVS